MSEEPTGNMTTRDVLFRIDGKLDHVASKQQAYEIEAALLKARVEEVEKDVKAAEHGNQAWREEVRAGIAKVQQEQQDISNRQKVTAYIVAAVVTLSTVVTPVVLYMLTNSKGG